MGFRSGVTQDQRKVLEDFLKATTKNLSLKFELEGNCSSRFKLESPGAEGGTFELLLYFFSVEGKGKVS